MKLRRLAFLGSVVAGAAYLGDKQRRDRLIHSASDFLASARRRLDELDLRNRFKPEGEHAASPGAERTSEGMTTEAPPVTEAETVGTVDTGIGEMPGAPVPRNGV